MDRRSNPARWAGTGIGRWAGRVAVTAVAVVLAASARPAAAGLTLNGEAMIVRQTLTSTVDDKGDMTGTGRLQFPTQAMYLRAKQMYPNPLLALRDTIGSGGKVAMTNATATWDDADRVVTFTATQLGAAVEHKRRWQVDVGHGTELLHVDGRTAVMVNVKPGDSFTIVASYKTELPAGADHVKVDAESGLLSFDWDRPAKAGPADLDVDIKVKPRLMSAVYKVYADPEFADGNYWTAKAVITNTGTGDLNKLKVRYKLGEYAADWSPATEYSVVAPGGHVVDLYYPLLKSDVAQLKSQSPVDLTIQYSYVDSTGKTVEDTATKRLTILGANQFEYANVPEEEQTGSWLDQNGNSALEAAFVTKLDEAVRGLGGIAAQACNGQPAGKNDKAAITFCNALYDTELANGLVYQWGTVNGTGKGTAAQSLKYPRDVIRDKSGTCIELAIMYAAVCESQGLSCTLVNIPGHCFPVVHLPSGRLLPVEATCISAAAVGVKQDQPLTFEQAVEVGAQEMKELEEKPSVLVDVDEMQAKGVNCPELSPLPVNVMDAWKWKLPDAQPAPGPAPKVAADARHPAALCGTWQANAVGPDGNPMVAVEQMKADGTYTASVRGGMGQNSDHGTWSYDDANHTLQGHSDVQGTDEVDRISLDGNVLTMHNDASGMTIRWTRK